MLEKKRFFNRLDELRLLEREFSKNSAAFSVIYGRRRVGKTALISEFIKNKTAIYFYATEMPFIRQLDALKEQCAAVLQKEYLRHISFQSFEQFFLFLADSMPAAKLVVVIDEFQELCRLESSFASMLQKIWDTKWQHLNIHLIVCGSVLSMMYSEVLNYSAPLYGRRTSNIKLQPLHFKHIIDFCGIPDLETQMMIYASFGTVPKYLELYDKNISFRANVQENILNRNSYLYHEAKFLLKDEIASPTTYFRILEIIASGDTKIGAIAARVGMPSPHLSRYMQKLIDLELLEKEIPVTEKEPLKSKLGRYRIKDNFLAFWFYFVYRNYSYLEIDNTQHVLKEIDACFNERFVSFAYEQYAKEMILVDPLKYLGFIPSKIGRWWNAHEEIDLVAVGENRMAFIECKWQSMPVGYNILEELKKKSALVPGNQKVKKIFILFSKTGFSDNLMKSEAILCQ
jgi:AAA+ ATPase superfamily predicted ATPase